MDRDRELLDQWARGDSRAGNELMRRNVDALLRFFYGKAEGHSEDLVQATLLTCVEARDRFRGEGSFRSFMFGVARNVLLRHYRNVHNRRPIDPLASSIHDLATSPSGAAIRMQQHELLRLALSHVPIDFQIALELHYFEGLSPAEIADVLEIEPPTVRTRLHRGRGHLRTALEKIESDPAARAKAMAPVNGEP